MAVLLQSTLIPSLVEQPFKLLAQVGASNLFGDIFLLPYYLAKALNGKKGVVYKLHAGSFTNRTPGEFINWGLLLNLKVCSVQILQKEGKV